MTEDANIHHNPYITASGITDDFDSTNLTFTLTPSQYINLPHTVLDYASLIPNLKNGKTKIPYPPQEVPYLSMEC